MIGVTVTVPKDVLRFEALLYLSLLIDALSAAFVGPSDETAASRASVSLFSAFLIMALFILVWLAAQRQQNWARWTLLGFFALTVVAYIQSFGEISFSFGTMIDMVSLAVSALGFYYAFTAEAQRWFKTQNT